MQTKTFNDIYSLLKKASNIKLKNILENVFNEEPNQTKSENYDLVQSELKNTYALDDYENSTKINNEIFEILKWFID